MKRALPALILALAPALSAGAAELTVFAASSLTDALAEIRKSYEAAGGDRIRFSFGASSTLALQIREGAPADIFFAADEMRMDDLARAGLLIPETRRTLLSNTLVIVVPKDSGPLVAAPADLAKPSMRVAVAQFQTVPAGIYARQYLQKLNLWSRVVDRVIPTENVRACLAAVESGNADAGIVYRTDALSSKQVRVAYEVPRSEGPDIAYPIAVTKASRNAAAARRFAEYLASPAALAVFTRFGFLTPEWPK